MYYEYFIMNILLLIFYYQYLLSIYTNELKMNE